MKKSKIVNVSSLAGKDGGVMGMHYATSKGGMIVLTFNLVRHHAPNILVNAVAPGPVDTELSDEEIKGKLKDLSVLGEIVKPGRGGECSIFLFEDNSINWRGNRCKCLMDRAPQAGL